MTVLPLDYQSTVDVRGNVVPAVACVDHVDDVNTLCEQNAVSLYYIVWHI
jgi:hypothetical protein